MAKKFYESLYSPKVPPLKNVEKRRNITNVGSEDIPDITVEEMQYALKHTKNAKAPGPDDIIIETIKHGGDALQGMMLRLLNRCLEEGNIPEE